MPFLNIDRDAFKAWAKNAGTLVVGHPNLPPCCPIARFLTETLHRNAWVESNNVSFAGDFKAVRYEIPQWVTNFIEIIDREETPITGFRAADIIDEELPEEF